MASKYGTKRPAYAYRSPKPCAERRILIAKMRSNESRRGHVHRERAGIWSLLPQIQSMETAPGRAGGQYEFMQGSGHVAILSAQQLT